MRQPDFPNDILKCIFLNEMYQFRLRFHWSFVPYGPNNNISALVQIMAWRVKATSHYLNQWWPGLPTHMCAPRPQWVKYYNHSQTALCLQCGVISLHFKYGHKCCSAIWDILQRLFPDPDAVCTRRYILLSIIPPLQIISSHQKYNITDIISTVVVSLIVQDPFPKNHAFSFLLCNNNLFSTCLLVFLTTHCSGEQLLSTIWIVVWLFTSPVYQYT